MKHFLPAAGLLLLAFIAAAADSHSVCHAGWIDFDKNGRKDVYEDPSQPVVRRVNDLLRRMTLDEKIGQLWQAPYGTNPVSEFADKLKRGQIGSFLDGSELIESPVVRNRLQRIVVEQSRLGIPLIFGHDVIHGFRTIFPIPLALACAWEPGLFQRTQTIAAREAAAAGIDWTFAPMVDLARDPRWGRIAEGFGEDPFLGALDAAVSVRGFQGTSRDGMIDRNHVVACLKHFVGYGAAEGGRDYNTTEISEFTLRNFYLPQFKAGVDAGALTVMSAFNDLSGMPASGNRHTLTEILRGQWHFPGYVVSDWDAVAELVNHGVAADEADAARLALTAGVDMEMVSTDYVSALAQQVQSHKIPEQVLDRAVRRVLTVKFKAGLFDRPFVDEARCRTAFLRPDAVALAREAAAKSCVLLKDENGALPLPKSVKKLALIGPLADDAEDLLGPWASRGRAGDVVTLAAGIRAKLPADATLTVARGCDIVEPGTGVPWKQPGDFDKRFAHGTGAEEIADAVALAKGADAVILALGEPGIWSGESASRETLGLPGRQQELFDAVAATGRPVIVVLFNGRPLAIPRVAEKAAAILEAWFPGTQGGNGVADVLFGDAEPEGRLTTTFPFSVGQVPIYYDHANTGRPGFGEYKGNYVDGPTTPLFPFGFGLAYTTFEFGKVQLDSERVSMDGTITARAQIRNSGAQAGTVVAELYVHALASSVGARPVRELKGFQKILLRPGESREVEFKIPTHDLGCYDAKSNWVVETGKYQLWIAADSVSGTPAAFELVK